MEDFWLDVSTLAPDRLHFTGTLTTSDVPEQNLSDWLAELPEGATRSAGTLTHGDDAYDTVYLVDGQQRLITATLLLLALCRSPHGDRERWRLIEPSAGLFRLGYEVDMPSHRYLLAEIYREQDSDEPRTAYTANLQNAKDYLDAEVGRASPGLVRDVQHKLLHQVVFVQNHLPEGLNASVVFERMNNRGKPLSQLELLKNRLLYLSQVFADEGDPSSRFERAVNRRWLLIYEWLGKKQEGILDDDDFLRNHWILYFRHDTETGSDIRTSEFSRNLLQDRFGEKQRNATPKRRLADIDRYSESLSEAARHWFAQSWPDDPAADLPAPHRLWLRRINAIRRDNFFRPIVNLLLLRDYPEELVTDCLRAIERHDFVLTALVGSRATANRPHFWRRANQLFRSGEPPEKLPAEIRRQTNEFYKQERVQKHMERVWISKEGRHGGWRAWRFLDYFLREYEAHLSRRPPSGESFTIQRVYPGQDPPGAAAASPGSPRRSTRSSGGRSATSSSCRSGRQRNGLRAARRGSGPTTSPSRGASRGSGATGAPALRRAPTATCKAPTASGRSAPTTPGTTTRSSSGR